MAEYITCHHNAPSSYQVAAAFGISRQVAVQHLEKLKRDGRITYVDGKLILVGAEYIRPDPP